MDLQLVSVHASYARHGYGRRLIEHLAGWSYEHGFRAVTLTTYRDVPWNAPNHHQLAFGRWLVLRSPRRCMRFASGKQQRDSMLGPASACSAISRRTGRAERGEEES